VSLGANSNQCCFRRHEYAKWRAPGDRACGVELRAIRRHPGVQASVPVEFRRQHGAKAESLHGIRLAPRASVYLWRDLVDSGGASNEVAAVVQEDGVLGVDQDVRQD